ncbi:MAG: carboxypeptidase-like regulatory domain-containing protein, partial [Segetibacter sp.]
MKSHRFIISLLMSCLALMAGLAAQAQSYPLKGKVVTEDKAPIEGVSIVNKTTGKGIATDNAGMFSINISPRDVLVISATGYVTEEIKAAGQTALTVTLKTWDKELGEVIVVGYGTQRKNQTTGSIASIKAAELTQTPVVNVAQGLQSRVSGVQINQNSGSPGGNVSVRIRGTN